MITRLRRWPARHRRATCRAGELASAEALRAAPLTRELEELPLVLAILHGGVQQRAHVVIVLGLAALVGRARVGRPAEQRPRPAHARRLYPTHARQLLELRDRQAVQWHGARISGARISLVDERRPEHGYRSLPQRCGQRSCGQRLTRHEAGSSLAVPIPAPPRSQHFSDPHNSAFFVSPSRQDLLVSR